MSFSVLMSVYIKENPEYLRACLESLQMQKLKTSDLVLVEDGPLTEALYEVIEHYKNILPINSVKLTKNQGLASALNEGLAHCQFELVARMDTDDIALPERFDRQVSFMESHPDIDVSSSWIEERDQKMEKTLFLKKLPIDHLELLLFANRRNPLNHPSTIFRKSQVLSVGGYPLIFPEDYALWSLMMVKGLKFSNIPEVLLYMRTGEDFIGRRGLNFLKGEIKLLKYQRKIGFLSFRSYLFNLVARTAVRLPPPAIRRFLYKISR
ncbi:MULTISPECIES: glycosyltransferase [unclassified Pseudomonas]|uniref:glycosyltransferase n=1 Tax=unclassified Pseudomonas TaxID=196821 RepID=UPI000837B1F4|nr:MULTISPECIES: glycosyltransferase [unclassified Pseudomonas]QIH09989.1 glycosyltransferase [Pseudomonas sp. BIOMIG1BAC]